MSRLLSLAFAAIVAFSVLAVVWNHIAILASRLPG